MNILGAPSFYLAGIEFRYSISAIAFFFRMSSTSSINLIDSSTWKIFGKVLTFYFKKKRIIFQETMSINQDLGNNIGAWIYNFISEVGQKWRHINLEILHLQVQTCIPTDKKLI